MVVAYFLVPVERGTDPGALVVRGTITAAGVFAAFQLISRQVRRQLETEGSPLSGLLLAIVAAVLIFALVDYVVAISSPREFDGLNTRVDALYFALTTLTTVGFGDVHAQGQLARVLLCIQLVFNVAVVAIAASILTRQIDRRLRERHGRPPDAGATDA